jgi:hypothetical protein
VKRNRRRPRTRRRPRCAGGSAADLDNIVLKALRKNPEQRYATAAELADDLQRRLHGFPVRARPDRFAYRARKFIVRRAVPLAAAATVIAAVVAGTLTTLAESRRAERRFDEVRALAHSFLFEVYDSISTLPGSVAARRLVVSRAQQYLDSLARGGRRRSHLDEGTGRVLLAAGICARPALHAETSVIPPARSTAIRKVWRSWSAR